jgi:tetratricopeptide (TPR) repeat protein
MNTGWLAGVLCLLMVLAGAARADQPPDFMGSPDDREPIFDGLGDIHHKVTHSVTSQDLFAQQFFDQGLAFIYAFNTDEALGSFREAARRDPKMAMAYWGIALALGPNYNDPSSVERGKQAHAAIAKARSLESGVTPAEREYIEALAKRFPSDGKLTAASAAAYADAMRSVAHHYPDDADASALFAAALMDQHPWALWTADGKPARGTEEILATLEATLAKHPNHIGANHYYIHAVEASADPGRGLAEAERLPKLAPGAGHLVHMPSHIYFRIGRYHDAAEANEHAVSVDRAYIRNRGDKSEYAMMYYPHNIDFLWASYMMEGQLREARKAARWSAAAVPLDTVGKMPVAEMMIDSVILTEVRFGEWNKVMKEPAPAADLNYSNVVYHYSRGMALAAAGKSSDAASELTQLDAARAKISADSTFGAATVASLAEIASLTLKGEQEIAAGKTDGGLKDLNAAVAAQDALPYEEPPSWYCPVREIYGDELMKAGKVAEAEQVYREDLVKYPENGWSLRGLELALRARGNTQEADAVGARFKKAWEHADVKLPAAAVEKTASR